MPVEIHWFDDARTIIYYTITDPWDWSSLHEAVDRAITMEKSAPGRVDVIVDMNHANQVPSNVITNLQKIANKQPDNLHLSVFIVRSRFYTILFQIISRLSQVIRRHYRMCTSLHEAQTLIQDDRVKEKEQLTR